jgi:hypothetical protein
MRESRHRAAVSPHPRAAASGWVLEAVFPDGKQATIAGFGTESEANGWLGSARHVAWLRDTRTAFSLRAIAATCECLRSSSAILAAAASGFLLSAQACIAARSARYARKWESAGRPRSVDWRTLACRCLFAATGVLLITTTVVAILAAALAPLGRSEPPAGLGSGTPPMSAAVPVVAARSMEATETPDPIAILLDRVFSSDASNAATEHPIETAAQDSAPPPAEDDQAAVESPATTPRHDLQPAAPLGIVGIWAPETTSSCAARNEREGALPAIISEHGARAGETSCVFKNKRRIKSDWRILANCTNGRDRWSSNVRLAVKGKRLIWTSERGTQSYVRCRPNV